MLSRVCSFAGSVFLLILNLSSPLLIFAQSSSRLQQDEIFQKDFGSGTSIFPEIFDPYKPQFIPSPRLENSPRLSDLIHEGKLELSLADALALALENNLDIEVQRYLLPISQTDVLRASSGQAARGFEGAVVPSGLNVGVLGAGVAAGAGGAGVGGAGGITGGGGAVQVGPQGTFDPAFTLNFSWDRTEIPLNTQVVAGSPTVSTQSTAVTGTYQQLFPTGTSYFVSLTGIRQGSDQNFLLFDPAVISRFVAGFNQPLLNGFGLLPNKRFLLVAQNNHSVSKDLFRIQLINVVVAVENLYWEMAAFQENVGVAERALEVAQKLYEDNLVKARVGTLARLDVVATQSEVAARQRDVIVARTNLQLQETNLKNALIRRFTPELDAARVVTTDPLPGPADVNIPTVEQALQSAWELRPELSQSLNNEENQQITTRFTKNGLLPRFSVFGLWAGSALTGNNELGKDGAAEALEQAFTGDFPEYAGGVTLTVPILNRAAQADDLRAQLELNQLRIMTQRAKNQIGLEVRQALVQVEQGKARLEAAREAVRLARETRDTELVRLQAGVSTTYDEVLRERDLLTAELEELRAQTDLAKALVEMERAMGTILDHHGIRFDEAVTGTVGTLPRPSFGLPEPKGGR